MTTRIRNRTKFFIEGKQKSSITDGMTLVWLIMNSKNKGKMSIFKHNFKGENSIGEGDR